MISPFFGIAHLQAYLSELPLDGFSSPYRNWIFIGQFFYLFLALLFLRQVLLRYYEDTVIAWTFLLISLGTNLLYYALYEPLMSHNYSFFLFSLSLFLTVKWLDKPQKRILFLLGFVIGLLATTRLTNLLYLLVLIFWNIGSWVALKKRFALLYDHKSTITIALLITIITFLPQIWYWHQITDYWWVNPYGDRLGTFFWTDPVFNELLWGYKKGWLTYSPLMILGVLGFFFLYRQYPKLFWSTICYTLLNWYVVSCWWCWWYGGSFGMRSLIESMAPLTVSIAALLHWAFESTWRKSPIVLFIFLGIGLNLFQTYQYSHNCIHSFAMTRKSYWAVFGQMPPLSPERYKEYDHYLLGVYMNNMTTEEREETKTYNQRSEK